MFVPAMGRSKGTGRIHMLPGDSSASVRLPQGRAPDFLHSQLQQVPARRTPYRRIPHSIAVACTIIAQRGATLQSRSFP